MLTEKNLITTPITGTQAPTTINTESTTTTTTERDPTTTTTAVKHRATLPTIMMILTHLTNQQSNFKPSYRQL